MMYCENCGARIDDDSRFCENCGALVVDSEAKLFEEESEPVTDLEQLMGMDEEERAADSGKESGSRVSDQTMIFVKPGRSAGEMEKRNLSEPEDDRFRSESEPEQKQEISYGLVDEDSDSGEQIPEDGVSLGLDGTGKKSDEPLELEIPDVLKPSKDDVLIWPERMEGSRWDAEEEWEEEADWQIEKGTRTEDNTPATAWNTPAAPESEDETEEEPEEEPARGFLGRTGLGAALKAKFRPEPEEEDFEDSVPEEDQAAEESEVRRESQEPQEVAGTEESPGADGGGVIPEPPAYRAPELEERGEAERQERPEDRSAGDEAEESGTGETVETGEAEVAALFCMACGRQLPRGAAFCDACGTPTGEVAPAGVQRKRTVRGIIPGFMKHIFSAPVQTIEKAASEEMLAAGIGFFVVKDIVLAVLAAVFMGRITAALGIGGSWIAGGDPFGFGAKVFLCGILIDALWIALLWGGGVLLKASCSVKDVIGACGTANIFPAVILMIAAILLAVSPTVGLCAVLIAAAVAVVSMTTAAQVALELEENRRLYLIFAVTACYILLLYLAAVLLF